METKQIIKGLGIVAILGGIARIGMMPSAYIAGSNSMAELMFGFIACIFMGIGIIGVYMYQAPKVGLTGFIATLFIAISNILTSALVWINIMGMLPEDHASASALQAINSPLMLLGQIIFAVTAIRARVYPLWTLILFIVYPAIYFIPGAISNVGSLAWGLCFVVFGLYIVQNRKRQA